MLLLKAPASVRLTSAGLLTSVLWLVVAALGAVEGLYGRTQYFGDWISYLNVSRAVRMWDWRNIFNPMWNPGYPALVSITRAAFPATAEGEWFAITFLNWLIYLFAYACWRFLNRQTIKLDGSPTEDVATQRAILWPGCCMFMGCTLGLDKVSNVSPDLLVTALFLLASALILRLLGNRSVSTAMALGAVLGLGCWAKAVFLTFSVAFLITLLATCCLQRVSWRNWLIAVLTFVSVFTPYVAGVSWSYGKFTLGASGPLNYAFHVSGIPHWANWQGGPSQFGAPLHPTRHLISDLPLFEFGAPFKSTYPPFNNLAYWYRGSKGVYSLKLQILGTSRAVFFLLSSLKRHPVICALALIVFALIARRDWRVCLRAALKRYWPLFLPVVFGAAAFLLVHVEDRYLSPLCLVAGLLPVSVILQRSCKSDRMLIVVVVAIYSIGVAAELCSVDKGTFQAALHREDFRRDPQWRLAAALPSYGVHRGDAIALIDDGTPAYRCHWAYVDELRIVAEFGSLPWTIAPWDRTGFDRIDKGSADEDYSALFWRLPSKRRAEVINAFRGTGARAVLSLWGPEDISEPGWQKVTGTGAWIYLIARTPGAPD